MNSKIKYVFRKIAKVIECLSGDGTSIIEYRSIKPGTVLVGSEVGSSRKAVVTEIEEVYYVGSDDLLYRVNFVTENGLAIDGGKWVSVNKLLKYSFKEQEVPEYDQWYGEVLPNNKKEYEVISGRMCITSNKTLEKMVRYYLDGDREKVVTELATETPEGIAEKYIKYLLEDYAGCKVIGITHSKGAHTTKYIKTSSTNEDVLKVVIHNLSWVV